MNNTIPPFSADSGGNRGELVSSVDFSGTTSNRDTVKERIDLLRNNINAMRQDVEDRLRKLSLVVTKSGDEKLLSAHVNEWPQDELGKLPDSIPFKHYKTLRLKSTAAARLLRRRWEDAARDVTGDIAIDPLMILDIIEQEMELIDNYLTTKGSHVDSKAEQEVLGNFEIWIQTALVASRRLHQRVTSTPQGDFQTVSDQGPSEQESVEARKAQARAKASLNGLNDMLRQEMQILRRDYVNTGLQFYRDTLISTVKRRALDEQDPAVASSFQDLLDDQMRRIRSFRSKVDAVETLLDQREMARSTIRELSYRGRALPTTGPDVMINIESSKYTDDDYRVILEEEAMHSLGTELPPTVDRSPEGDFGADHSTLQNLDADDHPQYLKKAGDSIEGDISMDPGTLIDGMRPGTHRHTGGDGTEQVRGEDIIGGTMKSDLVDTSQKPPTPYDLNLVDQKVDRTAPNSIRSDTVISWIGEREYAYEVEIHRVKDEPVPQEGPAWGGWTNIDPNDGSGYLQDTSSTTMYIFDPNSSTYQEEGFGKDYATMMRINADLTTEQFAFPQADVWVGEPSNINVTKMSNGMYAILADDYRSYSLPPRDQYDWERFLPFFGIHHDSVNAKVMARTYAQRRYTDDAFQSFTNIVEGVPLFLGDLNRYITGGYTIEVLTPEIGEPVHNDWQLDLNDKTRYALEWDYCWYYDGFTSFSVQNGGIIYSGDEENTYEYREASRPPQMTGPGVRLSNDRIMFTATPFSHTDGFFSGNDGSSWVTPAGTRMENFGGVDPNGRIWGWGNNFHCTYNESTDTWDPIAEWSVDFVFEHANGNNVIPNVFLDPVFDTATGRVFVVCDYFNDPRIFYAENYGNGPWNELDPELLHPDGRNHEIFPSNPNGTSRIRDIHSITAV